MLVQEERQVRGDEHRKPHERLLRAVKIRTLRDKGAKKNIPKSNPQNWQFIHNSCEIDWSRSRRIFLGWKWRKSLSAHTVPTQVVRGLCDSAPLTDLLTFPRSHAQHMVPMGTEHKQASSICYPACIMRLGRYRSLNYRHRSSLFYALLHLQCAGHAGQSLNNSLLKMGIHPSRGLREDGLVSAVGMTLSGHSKVLRNFWNHGKRLQYPA